MEVGLSPEGCRDCQELARLLLELDRVAKADSFGVHFARCERAAWRKACTAVRSPTQLIQVLLWFEGEMKTNLINGKWREHREQWEDKLIVANSCHKIALALYDFESHMLWKAVSDTWRQDRKTWARAVRDLYPASLKAISDCLLLLEKYTKYEVISQRWRGERAKWMHRTCYCRCTEELSLGTVLFAERLLGAAMRSEWAEIQMSWAENLQMEGITPAYLAEAVLQLERHMNASSLASRWTREFRSDWRIALQNITGVGR